jgi:hypothetical protein
MKEIYLIGCHITNDTQLAYLTELTNQLYAAGKPFVLTSHTNVPSSIVEKSVGFVYDSVNPSYYRWEFDSMPYYHINFGNHSIQSQYVSYGAPKYYHVGVIRLIINGIKYIQGLDYDVIHWIEYDCLPIPSHDEMAKNALKSHDFVFYGIGSWFSFLVKKVSPEFLELTPEKILKKLEESDWVAEILLQRMLIDGSTYTPPWTTEYDRYVSRYSQHGEANKLSWVLFQRDGIINVYLGNNSELNSANVQIKYNDQNISALILPYNWHLYPLVQSKTLGRFEIVSNENSIINLDLSDPTLYHNVVEKVKFL